MLTRINQKVDIYIDTHRQRERDEKEGKRNAIKKQQ